MYSVAFNLLLAVLVMQGGGPTDRQQPQPAAADRGRLLYTQYCINCHGSTAKGSDSGPDLIRSVVVLRDRLGNGIGPAIKKGAHRDPISTLTEAQIVDLSHFIHQRVEAVASNRNPRGPMNLLTGNAEAGRAFFNGAGKCSTCHSPTGDLQGIATRINTPLNLQQRFLFPSLTRGGPRQVEVTVTPASGPPVSGTLARIDDFNVSLRDAAGDYRTFRRAANVKVEVRDPLQAHHELLDQYTDADMHNLLAYLVTLK
jgi:cytochrome c oxidase cbb3-type subunit 3